MILISFTAVRAAAQDASETALYPGLKPDEFMKTWLILGPISVSDAPQPGETAQKEAFDADLLTEQGSEPGVRPAEGLVYTLKGKEYTWKLVRSESDIIDLTKIYGEKEHVVAYAWAEIEVPEAMKLILGIGSDDGVKVWLNGELVHENWVGRAVREDEDIFSISLREGKNQLLLKVQNQRFDWGFVCRSPSSEKIANKLILAAAAGDADAIEKLSSHGIDLNVKDKSGFNALHSARVNGREDMVKLLVEKGADPDIEMPPPEKLVDSVFQKVTEGDTPGVAVLVARDGKILYKKGFGFANLEDRIPVNADTKFRIGSITKQFTAAAILKLQEDGLLSVDDPISKFIPDYPRGDEVKLYHLLTHTSGIRSFTSEPEFYKTVAEKASAEEVVESFKNDEFDFDPGEKWLYNNSGYFLLGYIVEKVSGESFADYLKNHLFDPLGMKDTGIHSWDLNLENEASGYSYKDGKYEEAIKWDMSRAGGAGALYSTVGDLYRWNEAIFNGEILSKSSLDAAFTPARLNDGSEANAFGAKYGYGWMISQVRGLKEIQHGGGFDGFNAFLTRFPDYNFTIAVLTNSLPPAPPKEGSVGLISAAGARVASYLYLWEHMDNIPIFEADTTVDTDVYDDYVGRYDYGTYGGILDVTREGDRLFAQLGAQPKFEIFPSSQTEFFWKVADAQVTFVRNEEGEVSHLVHHQGGMEFKAPKVKEGTPADVDPSVYDAYTGEYDFGRAILTVTKEGDKLFAQMTGQPRFEIFPRSETEFFWKIVNAQITFIKNEEGKVFKALYRQGDIKFEVAKVK